ncbi:MAG TPA: DUF1152 domain-containing protein [Abditibacterium sp.]|jgi:hypothetical protein
MFSLPFFDRLASAQTILLAGAGGGYDFFCGLPLYDLLRRNGKTVHLANLSFSDVRGAQGRFLGPGLLEVTADTLGNEDYFPELHFCRCMRGRGEEIPVYTFERMSVPALTEAYRTLCDHLRPDVIVLVDGGTDSLMRGDEFGLGTPIEDVASIVAVSEQNVAQKMLISVGFGVDAYHGVCHAQWLEAVADLTQKGAYLGCFSLTRGSAEIEFYRAACEFVFRKMPRHTSIVSSSILAAVEGHFGDYHSTARTSNSELFINPLMSLVWCFELDAIAARLLYPPALKEARTIPEMVTVLHDFRDNLKIKPFQALPM